MIMEMNMMMVDDEDEDDECLWVFTESVEPAPSGMLPVLGC